MNKILTCLILASISINVIAADITGNSPTKSVTGVFDEPVDQYLDVIDFNQLQTSVLFLQFDTPQNVKGKYEVGVGNRLNDFLYLGGNLSIANIESKETKVEELGGDSKFLFDSDGNPTGRVEHIKNQIYKNGELELNTNIISGFKVGVFTIGAKAYLYYDEDVYLDSDDDDKDDVDAYTGKLAAGALTPTLGGNTTGPSLSFTTEAADEVTSTFNTNGNVVSITSKTYNDEGYINNNSLKYGLQAGTQLAIAGLKLDLRLHTSMESTDESQKGDYTEYKTNMDTSLPVYNGINGIYDFKSRTAEEINIKNDFSIGLLAETEMPISEQFIFGCGLGYILGIKSYQDGGITYKYNSTEYSTAFDTSGVFVDQTTTTNSYTKKDEKSGGHQMIVLPIKVKSTFGDKFEFGINNTIYFDFFNNESKTSATNVKKTTISSTDSTKTDTITTVTTNFRGTSVKEDIFTIFNSTNIGAQFFLTEKLRVNLGSSLSFSSQTTTTDESNDGNGSETTTTTNETGTFESSIVTQETDPNSGLDPKVNKETVYKINDIEYKAGITYFFNNNMFLDLNMTSNGDIWNTGVWSLLMTIKY